MPCKTPTLLIAVVLYLTASTVARAQSLGDVAKAEAERRAALVAAAKVLVESCRLELPRENQSQTLTALGVIPSAWSRRPYNPQ